jgi:two-component system chemotaxis response regulator CheY
MARVLLVEDDNLLRKSVHRILSRAGHEVWETTGPKVAMHMLTQVPVDVMITDIYMPGMNGVELITRLDRTQCPKVIAMTGGGVTRTPEALLDDARLAGAQRTLEKPFESRELIEALDWVLASTPA